MANGLGKRYAYSVFVFKTRIKVSSGIGIYGVFTFYEEEKVSEMLKVQSLVVPAFL